MDFQVFCFSRKLQYSNVSENDTKDGVSIKITSDRPKYSKNVLNLITAAETSAFFHKIKK